MLRFSRHAQDRMRERRVTREEVEQVLASAERRASGWTVRETNVWGSTAEGRRLRITVRTEEPTFVITVVALGMEVP